MPDRPPMSSHDTLCPCWNHKCFSVSADGVCFSCKCEEYAKVRADERQEIARNINRIGLVAAIALLGELPEEDSDD